MMNTKGNLAGAIVHDAPVSGRLGDRFWGSDAIAAMSRSFENTLI